MKKIIFGLIFFLFFLIISYKCLINPTLTSTPTPTSTTEPTKIIREIPKDQIACEALNGKWGRIGIAPFEECNLLTNDVGKACSDSNECEGMCIAELTSEEKEKVNQRTIEKNGKCSDWVVVVGCHAIVQKGQVSGIMCLD